ncbi:Di-copper centre-containing protein [Mycena rebaudengoi]|nr:Di-copper centre-containing protein [Mycena rebaudengoi]
MSPHLFIVHIATLLSLLIAGLVGASKCTHPTVRKEWRSLSRSDRVDWVSSIKCLANSPHNTGVVPTVNPPDIAAFNTSGSHYDDFVYAHMDLNHRIHLTGLFFPWHRWYLQALEDALRDQCGFRGTMPYWDWTKDAANFRESTLFNDSDPESGLGGFGDPSSHFTVVDGAFSASSSFQPSYPYPHRIRRNFAEFPNMRFLFPIPGFVWDETRPANASFTKAEINRMINGYVGDYTGFQAILEGPVAPHGSVHYMVGGDMAGICPSDAPADCISGPTFAPNDPLFFLHHTMIDRVWYKWQKRHKLNENAFEGGSVQRLENAALFSQYPTGDFPFLSMDSPIPTNGLTPTGNISDVMSTTGGLLCYKYD